ncbi:MAG TPA: FliM/FliN family flagellar motor switch protein [Kofleriaceae bacterium]
MLPAPPKFPAVPRATLARQNALARWVHARPLLGASASALAGAPVRVLAARVGAAMDPHAAVSVVKLGADRFSVFGASILARKLAQRVLGGPSELAAPRPLTVAEHAIFAAFVAALLEDAGLPGEAWPLDSEAPGDLVELTLSVGTLWARLPALPRFTDVWRADRFAFPILAGRCALPAGTRLAIGDVVIVERALELVVGVGAIGLDRAGRVVTGYVPREMAVPDDAHFELTVQIGAARLSLREVAELSIGQVIPLGRSLTDPLDVHAAGRRIGQGVLVDIDGELGVRIVSVDSDPEK